MYSIKIYCLGIYKNYLFHFVSFKTIHMIKIILSTINFKLLIAFFCYVVQLLKRLRGEEVQRCTYMLNLFFIFPHSCEVFSLYFMTFSIFLSVKESFRWFLRKLLLFCGEIKVNHCFWVVQIEVKLRIGLVGSLKLLEIFFWIF